MIHFDLQVVLIWTVVTLSSWFLPPFHMKRSSFSVLRSSGMETQSLRKDSHLLEKKISQPTSESSKFGEQPDGSDKGSVW